MAESLLYILGDAKDPPPIEQLVVMVAQRKTRQGTIQYVPDYDGRVYIGRIREKLWGQNYYDHRECYKPTTWRMAEELGDDLHIWKLGKFDDHLHGNLETWMKRLLRGWGWKFPRPEPIGDNHRTREEAESDAMPWKVNNISADGRRPEPGPHIYLPQRVLSFQEICRRSSAKAYL